MSKTIIGDVCVTATKDGEVWTILSTRISTGESLSQTTGMMTDFVAGSLYGDRCAMWRYAREPVSEALRELTEEPTWQ